MAEKQKEEEYFWEKGEGEEDVEEGLYSEEEEEEVGGLGSEAGGTGRSFSPSSSFTSVQWPQSYKYGTIFVDMSL